MIMKYEGGKSKRTSRIRPARAAFAQELLVEYVRKQHKQDENKDFSLPFPTLFLPRPLQNFPASNNK